MSLGITKDFCSNFMILLEKHAKTTWIKRWRKKKVGEGRGKNSNGVVGTKQNTASTEVTEPVLIDAN